MQRTAPPVPTPPIAAMNKQHPQQPTYIAMLPQQPDQTPPIILVTHPYIPPPPPYPIFQRPVTVPTLPQSTPIRLSQLPKPPSPPFTADQIVTWAAYHAKYGCTLPECPRNRRTQPPRSTHTSTSVEHPSPSAQPEASPFEPNTHALLDDILHLIRTEEQAECCSSSVSQTAMSNQPATSFEQVQQQQQQQHEDDAQSETSACHGRHFEPELCCSEQHDSVQFRVHGHEHICHALLDEAFKTEADEDVIQRIFSTPSLDANNVTPPNT